MEMLDIIAGLAWDPEMRGFMAVFTGIVVLIGSVWLILSTNSGVRLGTLITLAGLFGWMTILGTVWWMYGIGYKGDTPTWEPVEIVSSDSDGHLTLAALDQANTLRSEALPSAYQLVIGSDNAVAIAEFGPVNSDSISPAELLGLTDSEISALVSETQSVHESTTLSELSAVAPELVDEEVDAFGGWDLLSTAESGEVQTSAGAFLIESTKYDFGSTDEFRILNSYTIGGKAGLPENPNRWDRIYTQFRSAATIKHPTRYGIVQMQRVTPESLVTIPGEAPPRAVADTTQPVISVVMVRDLGNLRVLPALVAIGSGLIFLSLVYMLHERDKESMRRRAEFQAEAT